VLESRGHPRASANERHLNGREPVDIETLSTADLSDSYPDAQVCTLSLIQYGKTRRFFGSIRAVNYDGDLVVLGEVLRQKASGEILVVDANGRLDFALLGDRLASAAIENGWSGVVINGAVRDVGILANLDLGIKALGACPRRAPLSGRIFTPNSVSFGNTTFSSGDWLYSDDDGLLVSKHPLSLPAM
jgi:regulator of ribonuclease activity A